MLPKGSISEIIDYFQKEPRFAPAMEEAVCDFFEIEGLVELNTLQVSKMANDLFNEWLVFDCLLNSKRTILEEYLFIQNKNLSHEFKNIYSDLILTNRYSLFRTDLIELDKKIEVTDMLKGKKYVIAEQKATHEAIIGNYSFWRIALVKGEYNIVSADGFQIPAEALPLRIINEWKKRKIKFNPLVVYQQMLKPASGDLL